MLAERGGVVLRAEEVKPGDWIIREGGSYLVDAVAAASSRVYIGTNRGVLVLPWDAPVLTGRTPKPGWKGSP